MKDETKSKAFYRKLEERFAFKGAEMTRELN